MCPFLCPKPIVDSNQIPDEPEEPTLTIVLTSPRSNYVDVRMMKDQSTGRGLGEPGVPNTSTKLQWAFAGRSESYVDSDGRRFSTWHHWVDSKTDDPALDRGEMITQENGDALEKGTTVEPETGEEYSYEELWTDLPLNTLGTGEKARVCTVLRTTEAETQRRGIVIRIGGWCQGILKKRDEVSVERWQLGERGASSGNDGWNRIVKIGIDELPCGKILNTENPREGQQINYAGISWAVVEVSTW